MQAPARIGALPKDDVLTLVDGVARGVVESVPIHLPSRVADAPRFHYLELRLRHTIPITDCQNPWIAAYPNQNRNSAAAAVHRPYIAGHTGLSLTGANASAERLPAACIAALTSSVRGGSGAAQALSAKATNTATTPHLASPFRRDISLDPRDWTDVPPTFRPVRAVGVVECSEHDAPGLWSQ